MTVFITLREESVVGSFESILRNKLLRLTLLFKAFRRFLQIKVEIMVKGKKTFVNFAEKTFAVDKLWTFCGRNFFFP